MVVVVAKAAASSVCVIIIILNRIENMDRATKFFFETEMMMMKQPEYTFFLPFSLSIFFTLNNAARFFMGKKYRIALQNRNFNLPPLLKYNQKKLANSIHTMIHFDRI